MTKLISQRDKFLNKNKTEKWEIKQAAASNLSSAPTLKNNPYKRNSEIYVPRVKIMNTDHNRRQHSNKIINNNVQYIFYKRTHKSKEKLGMDKIFSFFLLRRSFGQKLHYQPADR